MCKGLHNNDKNPVKVSSSNRWRHNRRWQTEIEQYAIHQWVAGESYGDSKRSITGSPPLACRNAPDVLDAGAGVPFGSHCESIVLHSTYIYIWLVYKYRSFQNHSRYIGYDFSILYRPVHPTRSVWTGRATWTQISSHFSSVLAAREHRFVAIRHISLYIY